MAAGLQDWGIQGPRIGRLLCKLGKRGLEGCTVARLGASGLEGCNTAGLEGCNSLTCAELTGKYINMYTYIQRKVCTQQAKA